MAKTQYLLDGVVLAIPPVAVLIVQYIHSRLPFLQLQSLYFSLQFIQLLLEVLALFHVLYPENERRSQLAIKPNHFADVTQRD